MELNIFVALLAGFISFLSPCIFPIIPSYITYIGAATYDEGFKKSRGATLLILSFILGFTLVFTLMGVIISTLGFAFKEYATLVARVSGVVVILLGLNMVFNFLKFLDYEKKADYKIKNKGFISSLLLGMAFGAGWSPCIGPILASILFMAGNSQTLISGSILLIFFSLGLGIPFLLSGLFITKFREKSRVINRHLGKIRVGGGILIILIGISIFFDRLSQINITLSTWGYNFSVWYESNGMLFNIILGIIWLMFTTLVIFSIRKRNRSGKKIWFNIILGIGFVILALLSFTSTINWGELISSYLTFQGL